jgi:hypothetical protein
MSYLGTKENAKADQSSVEVDKDMGGTAVPANAAASGVLSQKRTTIKTAAPGKP